MSAAGRGARRGGSDDFYVTPHWAVDRLLEKWSPPIDGDFVEPCAGNGAIMRALRGRGLTWDRATAIECRAKEYDVLSGLFDTVKIGDFLAAPELFLPEVVSTIITNPPYIKAEEFIRAARAKFPNATSAWLVRQGFLASEERVQLWKDVGSPDVYVLPNRPSYTADGKTDASDYCWIVLPKEPREHGQLVMLGSTPKEVRVAALLKVKKKRKKGIETALAALEKQTTALARQLVKTETAIAEIKKRLSKSGAKDRSEKGAA